MIDIDKILELTEVEKAYLAGFFDGEGHVSITYNHGKHPYVHVGLAQNRPAVLHWVSSLFSGKVHRDKNGTHKWQIGGRDGVKCFLRIVRPYLRIKAQEADEAMLMLNSPVPYTTEQVEAARERLQEYRKPTLVQSA